MDAPALLGLPHESPPVGPQLSKATSFLARKFSRQASYYEDLCQEGLLASIIAARSFRNDGGASFPTYALHCAQNRMLDYLRREKRVTPKNLISGDIPVGVEDEDTLFDLLPGQSAFTESPENRPLIGQLNVAVARLPERERLAVELSFFRELTHEEIAASLGVTRARVGQLLSRAIARLRNAMTQ